MRSFVKEPETQGKIQWHVIAKLGPYLWEYRARAIIAMTFLVMAKLSGIGLPIALKHIVDHLDPSLLSETGAQLITVPVALLIIYGLLRFFNVFFSELRDTIFSRVTERAQRRVGLDVFRHLYELELDFHLSRKTGGLSREMERGTRGISFLLRFALFNIIPTFLEIILVSTILLVSYNYQFALIALMSVIIYIGFSVYITEWRTGFVRSANQMDNKANTRAIDALLNYETVKYFGNENYEAELYDSSLANWESARLKNRLSLTALNSGQAFIIAASITSMMFIAAQQVQDGAMSLGDLVLVNAFMIQLFMPLNVLGFVYRELKASLADIETLFKLLQQTPKVIDKPNATEIKAGQKSIHFKNVNFHYHPNRPILKNINFSIDPGQRVAIVGRSGSGKSTIARLLFRFYDVSEGQILLNDQDIREVTQNSLRGEIGVVPQDTVLFNDTIYHNIHYGLANASEREVHQAANSSHLGEFINQLPEGYDTLVGERGLKISGGEKQRIAIARVILKNPQILIFDEATSSLDSEAEQTINQSLNQISKHHSTLVIAHRLSTIVDADQILVLDQGEIIEKGKHQELIALKGLYAQLWDLQQKKELSSPSPKDVH